MRNAHALSPLTRGAGLVGSARAAVALVGLGLALLLAACMTPAPDADGRALGTLHAQLLKAGDLTVDELAADLKKAQTRHATPKARRAFADAYRQAIKPARAELATLIVQDSSGRAAQSLSALRQRLGDGFQELVDEIGASMKALDADLKGTLRDFGREIGKTMKEVSEGAEALGQGVAEGLEGD